MENPTNCPLCRKKLEKSKYYAPLHRLQCSMCGMFDVSQDIVECSINQEVLKQVEFDYHCDFSDVLFKASCIAAEKKLKFKDRYTLVLNSETGDSTISIFDFIKDFPNDPIDQFNRSLLNFSKLIKRGPFGVFQISDNKQQYLFLENKYDFPHMINLLVENQFINITTDLSSIGEACYNIVITPQGWQHISELTKLTKLNSNKAFIAMWFDESTAAFREAARAGVQAAGYEMIVVDETHHNDYIMDSILNSINDSKFIIADFTCEPEDKAKKGVRGGVYYEAGFAAGQNKQVIMTCRDTPEAVERRHFDVEQKNTIFWKENKDKKIITVCNCQEYDLADFLKERIIRTVGKGEKYPE